jgi:hypothetical protein
MAGQSPASSGGLCTGVHLARRATNSAAYYSSSDASVRRRPEGRAPGEPRALLQKDVTRPFNVYVSPRRLLRARLYRSRHIVVAAVG